MVWLKENPVRVLNSDRVSNLQKAIPIFQLPIYKTAVTLCFTVPLQRLVFFVPGLVNPRVAPGYPRVVTPAEGYKPTGLEAALRKLRVNL